MAPRSRVIKAQAASVAIAFTIVKRGGEVIMIQVNYRLLQLNICLCSIILRTVAMKRPAGLTRLLPHNRYVTRCVLSYIGYGIPLSLPHLPSSSLPPLPHLTPTAPPSPTPSPPPSSLPPSPLPPHCRLYLSATRGGKDGPRK